MEYRTLGRADRANQWVSQESPGLRRYDSAKTEGQYHWSVILKRLRRRAAEDVRTRLGAENIFVIDERANSFGIESKGVAQIRGNGCLAASDDELMFLMWLPRRELVIPRELVTGVDRVRSHLGKTIGRDLLKVSFTNSEGNPDSIAWYVSDIEAWESALSP